MIKNVNKSFKGIVSLPELEDEVRKEYNSRMRCAGYMSHIADILRKDFISEVQKHEPFIFLLDASNDKNGIAKLLL